MSGGKRTGAGRPKGSSTRKTRELLARAAKGGELPIDYMLRIMRDEDISSMRRDNMAKAAAAYLHSRLHPVDEESESDSDAAEQQVELAESAKQSEPADEVR